MPELGTMLPVLTARNSRKKVNDYRRSAYSRVATLSINPSTDSTIFLVNRRSPYRAMEYSIQSSPKNPVSFGRTGASSHSNADASNE